MVVVFVQLEVQSSRSVLHDALQLSSSHFATQVVFVSLHFVTQAWSVFLPVWSTLGFSTFAVQPTSAHSAMPARTLVVRRLIMDTSSSEDGEFAGCSWQSKLSASYANFTQTQAKCGSTRAGVHARLGIFGERGRRGSAVCMSRLSNLDNSWRRASRRGRRSNADAAMPSDIDATPRAAQRSSLRQLLSSASKRTAANA